MELVTITTAGDGELISVKRAHNGIDDPGGHDLGKAPPSPPPVNAQTLANKGFAERILADAAAQEAANNA